MIRPTLALVTALIMLGTAAAAKKQEPEVLVVGDVMAEVPESVRPTPDKPVHYVILGNVEHDLGNPIAGMPQPDPKAMQAELVKVLASQGFLETKIGGPLPQIALLFSWGTANMATDELVEDDPETGETTSTLITYNRREIRQLVGADKAERHLLMTSDADQINEAARYDRVYLFVAALDAQALRNKKKVLVWRTRISIDSLRHSLPDSFALMLASAAPYFGRDTERPVFVDERMRGTSVRLGEMKVIEEKP